MWQMVQYDRIVYLGAYPFLLALGCLEDAALTVAFHDYPVNHRTIEP